MPRKKRISNPQRRGLILKGILTLLILLIVIAGVGIGWLFYGSLPVYTGDVPVAGMAAPVHIYHDKYGVPHIFAGSMDDAMRALGFAHASERFFQMEMQRRAGQGRLAEAVGPSMLGVDKFIRTLNLYPLAQSSLTSLSPYAQDLFDAYTQGVNAWLDTHRYRLPPEFALLGINPEPWQPADSLVWSKLMALQLSKNYKLELLRAELAKTMPAAQLQGLFPPYGDAPVTLQPQMMKKTDNDQPPAMEYMRQKLVDATLYISAPPKHDPQAQLAALLSLGHGASNEWVVTGAHTDTGKPILANDPHLGLEAPVLWYLARIVTPEGSVKGATVPGLPVVLLGQNDHIAWGLTTTGSDVEDLFIETVDPQDPTHYLTPEGSRAFDDQTQVIHVKGQPDTVLHIRATRHGPVLSDLDPEMAKLAGPGKVMALQFTGLGAQDTTAEALLRVDRAANWQDFTTALKLYQAPPQNFVFADDKDDIGFINPGLLPIRKAGDGLTPADGASGVADWIGAVPFNQWPQLLNPPAGFIFNANNAITPPNAKPYLGSDWEEPFRAERLQQLLGTNTTQSLKTAAAMQADDLSLAAKALLPYLLRQHPLGGDTLKAFDLLRKWDGTMSKDRPEPLIFEAWLLEMHQHLLVDKAGQPLTERGPYAATSLLWILSHPADPWCGGTCDPAVRQAFDDALTLLKKRDGRDMAKWRWGDEHITLLTNKVFDHIPLLRRFADLAAPADGDFYTLDRGGSFENDPEHLFTKTQGGGYRGIYDLDDSARSRFMIATGESGHLLSKHYADLLPLWSQVKSITLTGSEDELRAQHANELVLEPKRF